MDGEKKQKKSDRAQKADGDRQGRAKIENRLPKTEIQTTDRCRKMLHLNRSGPEEPLHQKKKIKKRLHYGSFAALFIST